MVIEPLLTPRLVLRPIEVADAEAVFAYRGDPAVSRFQSFEPRALEDVVDFLEPLAGVAPDTPGRWFQLGIVLRADGPLIGDLGLRFPADNPPQVEFGISLAPSFQGRGLAQEALEAAFDFVFFVLEKHRVFGSADPRNTAALKLMERIGMRREAHFRKSLWFKGEWADDIICATLREEWRSRRSRG